jgi:hypothetical protein
MASPQKSFQAEASSQTAPVAESKIEVSAQILTFDPGLYSVDVAAPRTLRGISGMVVPCIRLDPVHAGDHGRAFVSTLSDSPLIQPGDNATYLRVQGAKASVLLTIYKLAGGMAAPELRITLVQPAAASVPETRAAAALASEPLKLMAHVERAGDLTVQGGLWAGQPGGRGAIEGFSVTPGDAVKPDDIEYQAVLGSDWTTPWLSGGEFCGSRGLSLPLLGARIRLRNEAAKAYSISYWGSFIGAGETGPVADGAVCSGGGASLEALRVVLTRRQAQASATLVNHPSAATAAAAAAAKSKQRPGSAAPAPVGKTLVKPAKVAKVTALNSIRSKLGRK